jgi:4-aminobutyrate aminotransferase
VVEDLDGNRYLDFTAGTRICPAGHNHPHIMQAWHEQVGRLRETAGGDFATGPMMALAGRLGKLLGPKSSCNVLYAPDPAGAIRAALRLAKLKANRDRLVIFAGARHEEIVGAMDLVSSRATRGGAVKISIPMISCLPYNNLEELQGYFDDRPDDRDRPAAIIVEPMLHDALYAPASVEFLQGVRKICDETGTLLIVDESYIGLGRSGKMFAFEHAGITPDMVILSSGYSTGSALSAALVRESLITDIAPVQLESFLGNPVAASGMMALFDLLEKSLIESTARLAPLFEEKLKEIVSNRSGLRDVTGMGFVWSVAVQRTRKSELSASALRDRLVYEAFSRGLLLWPRGEDGIQFSPPLCINRVQLEVGLNVFDEVVQTIVG